MNIGELLINRNIKPSFHRIKVLEYLILRKNHPTVDQIYNELVNQVPTFSKTTVYNTLNLFTEAGLTRIVTIEDNETRYDADTSNHGHFKCEQCQKIFDFQINIDSIEINGLQSFKIREKNVYYKGTCHECLKNNQGG